MNKPVLFYSALCPDTKPFTAELERLKIDYKPINIFESMANFKLFLNARDSNVIFDESKRLGNAGIPALMVNEDKIILSLSKLPELQSTKGK